MEGLKTLALWFASFIKPVMVPVWITPRRHHKRFAHVMRFGSIALVPLVMGAAFTELVVDFDALTAGTDVALVLGSVPSQESQQNWSVTRASVTSPSLVTGATATAITFTFSYRRAGAAAVPFATLVTITGKDLAAGVEVDATLLAAAQSLQAGDVIQVVTTHASTGTATPVGMVAKVELA